MSWERRSDAFLFECVKLQTPFDRMSSPMVSECLCDELVILNRRISATKDVDTDQRSPFARHDSFVFCNTTELVVLGADQVRSYRVREVLVNTSVKIRFRGTSAAPKTCVRLAQNTESG